MAATLKVDTITNASNAGTANLTLDDAGNATVGNTLAMGSSFKRNRIINGDMRVDQRNAGASGTASAYTVDRWFYGSTQSSKVTWQQNAGSVTPPAGFTNYLGITSSSAYSVLTSDTFYLSQPIEGYNVADLAYGTASAKTVTLSFWARSTGLSYPATFGGSIYNAAANKSYLFSYSIPSSGTWTYVSVTITGDTASATNTTTSTGFNVWFGVGSGSTYTSATTGSWIAGPIVQPTGTASVVGTNGATFYITGVQLEVGSIATPYERQIYSEQLAQCQRYYWKINNNGGTTCYTIGQAIGATSTNATVGKLPVTMRVTPTVAYAGNLFQQPPSGGTLAVSSISQTYGTPEVWSITVTCASGLTAGNASGLFGDGTSSMTFSAEL